MNSIPFEQWVSKKSPVVQQRQQEAVKAATSLEVQVQQVKPELAAALSASSLPGQLLAEHSPCALQVILATLHGF